MLSSMAAAAFAADPQVAAFIDTPDPVPAGGLVTYSARIDNDGADASLNTVLTVAVPAGATFVSVSPPAANCTYTAPNVVCALGSVAPGGIDERNVDVVLRALGPGPTTLSVTATVTASNDDNPANNSQTQTTTVINGADLALTKVDTPDPVAGGSNVTYTLTVANAGPNDSAGIRIIDNLPPATTFVSATNTDGWTCAHAGGVVTCTRAGPHTVGAAIPPVTIVATVTASGGNIVNSATVSPFEVGGVPPVADPITANNTATADTTVVPGANLAIGKAVTSGVPATAGQNVTFLLTPRNTGPATAVNAVVTDVLPVNWVYVSATGSDWSCSVAGQTVTCTRASLPMGSTDNITLIATAPTNAQIPAGGQTFRNNAAIASSTPDPVTSNNTGFVDVQVRPDGADLRMAKTKSPSPVAQGQNMTSVLTLTNNGPRTATGPLRIVDYLSAGETFVSASGTGWTCALSGSTLTCDHANASGLAINASLPTVTVVTTATQSGTLINTACTGSSVPGGSGGTPRPPIEGDPNIDNDCADAGSNSTVLQPDLGITKTAITANGDAVLSATESSITFNVVVTNLSATDPATGVRIDDTLPSSFFINGTTSAPTISYVVSSGSTITFTCGWTQSSRLIRCSRGSGSLLPGGTVTVSITVQRPVLDGASFTNTASVTNTLEGDPNPNNNNATATFSVAAIADVAMEGKTVTPSPVGAGQNATYVLSYRNLGPSTAQNLTITDTFAFPPGDTGVTVVSYTATGASCPITIGMQITPASPGFSCTRASLGNGLAGAIELVVRPNFQPGNPARTIANAASITTTTAESTTGGDGGNNSRTATLNVLPATLDLLVNKIDVVDPVGFTTPAPFINYRVRITNNGPSFGTNVTATESMQAPAGKRIEYICDTTAQGGSTCRGAATTCSLAPNTISAPGGALNFTCQVPPRTSGTDAAVGTLAAGQFKDIFLRFRVLDAPAPAGDVYVNTATVAANETDTFPGNNSTSESTTVRQLIDLQATKTSSAPTVTLNQPFNWTVVLRNAGPANALATELTDTLPAGVELTGPVTYVKTAPAGSGNCSVSGTTVSCAMGALDNAATATVTISARFTSYPASGSATNSVTLNADPALTGAIDNNASNNTATNTVNVTRSSLAGLVFRDRNNDGLPGGAGETGIGSVAIALTGTDAYGNAITRNVTTAADGTYTFGNLPPSDATGYTLTQTQPAAYVNGANPPPASADSLGGTRPAPAQPGFGTVISAIPVGGNVAGINYTFAEVQRPSIGGTVFRDHNNNGVQNGGETGIAGVTIQLRRSGDDSLVATATTNASGAYQFASQEPGSYTIVELQPAGFLDGLAAPGQIGGVACATCSTSMTYDPANEPATISRILGVDVTNGDNATLMNFGELVPSTLAGSVFVDFNNNGTRQGSEPGIAANALALTGTDDRGNAVSRALTTDATGNYSVANLRPANAGGYAIRQTQPAGFDNGINPPTGQADSLGGTRAASGPDFGVLIAAIPLAANQNGINYTFAEVGGAAISGLVWVDRNRDGALQAPTEPGRLSGATIQLVDPVSGTVIATTTTAADGTYGFGNAPVGNYRIVMLTPAGYGTSTPTALNVTITPAGLTDQNFGATAGSLAGQVFLDANNNGTPQVGDTPIAGNTIELLNATSAVIATTTSDAGGQWRFDDLPAATYSLRQPTQPPGTTNGLTTAGTAGGTASPLAVLPSAVSAIVLPLVNDATGYYFAEIQFSSLAGSVYSDANNNGARDPSETGYSGQQVVLTGTNDLGQAINTTATTDADGYYAFPNLRPGSYTIAQPNAPPGTLNGITSAGSAGGTATPVTTLPSAISGIALGAMVAATNYNFGELTPSSFSGSVYNDANNNGQREPAEQGFAGQTVVLTGTNDLGQPVNVSVVTDASGNFTFPNLRPGTYTLTQPNQPVGTVNGITTAGSAGGTATPVATVPSAIAGIVLAPGTPATGYLFGERASGSIAGSVYVDANNNGVRDPSEQGIAGQTITLTGTDSFGQAINQQAVTDVNGNYVFSALFGGTYALTQPAQPANTLSGRTAAGSGGGTVTTPAVTPSVISAIALPPSAALTGYLFGELPTAQLAGSVFNDINNNGVRDGGETGFANNTLTLTGTDDLGQPVSLAVATDANGDYVFANLRPGTYTITQPAQPPATINGITTAGTLGGTATPVATLPSAIAAITVPPGGQGSGYLFAEIGNSPDIVGSKAAVGVFATGNDASYRITVANVGQIATTAAYTVQDRLPAGMTLAATPSGSGWTCTGARGDASFTCTGTTVLAPSAAAAAITVPVSIAANAVTSGNSVTLNNPVLAQGGGELPVYAPTPTEVANFNTNPGALPVCPAVSTQNACRTPTLVQQSAAMGGVVWYDTGTVPRQLDAGDQRLVGWTVEVVDAASGSVVRSIVSGSDGSWRAADLLPATEYLVRFRDPAAGITWGVPVSGDTGTPPAPCVTSNPGFTQRSSCVDTAEVTQLRAVLLAGDNLLQQSLPVDPAGVVYDALTRAALPGAIVTLSPVGMCAGYNPAAHVANAQLGGYTISGTSVSMTTGALGAYQFLFTAAAPASCAFQLAVTPPSGYSFVSQMIPPQSGTFATPPAPGTVSMQPQAGPPPVGSSTTYYLTLNSGSGTQSVINNHIPVDPASISGIVIVKTGSTQVVELGDSLQYTVRIRNTTTIPLATAFVDDRLPAGFRYIPGTAQVTRAGAIAKLDDPTGSPGPNLTFAVGTLPPNDDVVLTYRVRVGVGSMQGNGTNTAQAKPTPGTNCAATPQQCSNVSQFKVRVEGGVFTDEACVAGKVYMDCNGNRMQDDGEVGIPGVRLWLQNGTFFVTDSEGRYSYCGLRPMMHVLKVDKATLPQGSQLAESSNRNLGDPGSLMLDIKKGELHRGDFIEGSCKAPVADEVYARRSRGEVGGPMAAPADAPTPSGRPANGGTLQFRSVPPPGSPVANPQGGSRAPR